MFVLQWLREQALAFAEGWQQATPTDRTSLTIALLSLIATVVIPVMLHRMGKKADAAAEAAADHMRTLQEEALRIAAQTRRDELVLRLDDASSKILFDVLVEEVEQRYKGKDLAMLRRIYRQNPLQPLPTSGEIKKADIPDFVAGVARRARGASWSSDLNDLIRFATVVDSLTDIGTTEFAEQVHEGTRGKAHHHEFFRELCCAAPALAPQLLYWAERGWSVENPGHSLNMVTGVCLAMKDLELHRGNARTLSPDEIAALYRSLEIPLLSTFQNTLQQVRELYPLPDGSRDTSEPLSATVAWAMRLAGRTVTSDGHVPMRYFQAIPHVMEALEKSGDRAGSGWGVDVEDVIDGLTKMRRNCPRLWAQYGEETMRVCNVRLP